MLRIVTMMLVAVATVALLAPIALASFTGKSSTLGITNARQSRCFVEMDSAFETKIHVFDANVADDSLTQLEAPIDRTAAVKAAQNKSTTSPSSVANTQDENGWYSGQVSVYGIADDGFFGKTCADGSTVTSESMGIAGPYWMEMGTKIEFSYNGKTCVATVCDRGNFESYGRTFDLQPAVASALGIGNTVVTLQWRYA